MLLRFKGSVPTDTSGTMFPTSGFLRIYMLH